MYFMRKLMVTRAKSAERVYHALEELLVKLEPVWNILGEHRVEKTLTFVEKNIKGLLFDCKMCGNCVLDKTGMSCPMNCPKQIRNGPCGGVRDNGHCEIKPEMRCVWIEAWRGAKKLTPHTTVIPDLEILEPVNQVIRGRSSWHKKYQEIRQNKNQASLSDEA